MAVMGLSFPAVLHFTHSEVRYGKSEVALSRFSSCIMLVAYASYLVFQLSDRETSHYSPVECVSSGTISSGRQSQSNKTFLKK
jgi:Ca2+:H+ antiporter